MKRDSRGAPMPMVQRWSRPPLSCQPCREKKRRCDRTQPCSNCALRNLSCEYEGQSQNYQPAEQGASTQTLTVGAKQTGSSPSAISGQSLQSTPDSFSAEDMTQRIRRLEAAVFEQSSQGSRDTSAKRSTTGNETRSSNTQFTPFHFHPAITNHDDALDVSQIARHLPPLLQARELFNQFVQTVQPTFNVLHMPSTRELMEQTYQTIFDGGKPSIASVLLLLSIFGGAALSWSPQLLDKLKATPTETKAAFQAYTRLAMSFLDSYEPLAPSTTALAAMSTLAHVLANSDGYIMKIHLLRTRCVLMARKMQVPRLDTVKSQEERRLKGCNFVEIEVQRRVWWNMVAGDWLGAFSGSPQEGSYTFQTKHMCVNYPSNVDDELITPANAPQDLPWTQPTSMGQFLYRVKLSDICRQAVDAMPSVLLEEEPEYDVILDLDTKFQNYLSELPLHFRLDPTSMELSKDIVKQRPHIAWQRLGCNFSLQSRLCRLHRPYHLEGTTNPKYAYSHKACIRAAYNVLELRRMMDDASEPVGLKPGRFWTVMQHVSLAALILATDVSFNPKAPDAEARKAKVLAAYRTLERSREESSALMEGIQRNMQTLMSTLHRRPNFDANDAATIGQNGPTEGQPATASGLSALSDMPSYQDPTLAVDEPLTNGLVSQLGQSEGNWDQLWSDFLAVAPDLDVPQWNSLLDDMDFDFNSIMY